MTCLGVVPEALGHEAHVKKAHGRWTRDGIAPLVPLHSAAPVAAFH